MRKTKHYFVFFVIAIITCASIAVYVLYKEKGVPNIPFEEAKATQIGSHIDGSIHVNELKVVLEETSLLELQQKTGALIRHQGDAGDSLYFLCYNSDYKSIPIQVWFFSGELGGERHLIHGVYVQRGSYFTGTISNCMDMKESSILITIDDQFWIDQSMDRVNKKIGIQASSENGWKFYSHAREEDNKYQRQNILGVELYNQRIKSLYLGQTTTY